MICTWLNPSPAFGEQFICRQCGGCVTRDDTIAVLPYRRGCGTKRDLPPCRHVGEQLRTQECPTCSGRVRVKVFTCAVHGECTVAKRIDNVALCDGCIDHA